jgi:hypothetical protein
MKFAAMKLAAVALAFTLSSTCAFAHTARHKSKVETRAMGSDAAPSVVSQPKYGNPDGAGNRDVWGHWGAYYGPMIPTGGGGR